MPDSTRDGAPSSIAAVGLALACYGVAAERGFVSRDEAAARTRTTLRFFRDSPQGPERDATGHHGFFYHFLDMTSGRRAQRSELSTIDTTILLTGALTARQYFDGDAAVERDIRELADGLYRAADWRWVANNGLCVTHGWKPECGFLSARWVGYNEALLLYVLALAAPDYGLTPASYGEWLTTYRWKRIYGYEYVYAGPLFIHQIPQLWIDFRGMQDAFTRSRGIDYFENSRRATYVQREYAVRNPRGFARYDHDTWGITASSGPGPAVRTIAGRTRRFHDYVARGVPFGPDDGTLSPWGVIASLPFAPEIVLPTIRHLEIEFPELVDEYGFHCSFNPTFPLDGGSHHGWVSPGYFGIDQGPIVLMIENYCTGLVWRLMRNCEYIVAGLRQAGFQGGWV
ncbi:MAG: glucoamylase family protein [Gemmatimonadota bacterium]